MIETEASTIIRKPVDEVFAYATDPAKEPTWHTDALEARPLSPGPIGVGSRTTFAPLMRRMMGRQNATYLDNLKRQLE